MITLVARDPEGTDIVWSVLPVGTTRDRTPDDMTDDTENVELADTVDAADFDVTDGVLTFRKSPDFETPTGGGVETTTNEYKVTVQASDGGQGIIYVDWFKVTVNVKDVEEEGTVRLGLEDQPLVVVLQPQVGVEITAILTDPDGNAAAEPPVEDPAGFIVAVADVSSWQWYRTTSREADGTKIDGGTATTAAYTPMDTAGNSDVGSYLRVVASYTDRRGAGKTAVAVSEYMTLDDITNNTAPSFSEGATTTRAVVEGTPSGMPIGAPVTATTPTPAKKSPTA